MLLEPWMQAAVGGLFGLMVGSFLNVVVHRLPRMLEQQWNAECAQWAQEQSSAAPSPQPSPAQAADAPLSLSRPRSRCPHCGHAIHWYENIPVLSYLALRGRCSECTARISVRYPLVELAIAVLFLFLSELRVITPTGAAWCLFSAALLSLALIDWDTTLLPDDITLPLLWAGLLASALHWTAIPLADAVWGATGGYLSLWLVYWAFKLATGKEGMGYGDFKLFAALGAWFGWQALVPIILISSVIGAIVGIALKINSRLREGGYIPFGPFLAGAGFAAMVFGPQQMLQSLLSAIGL
jgi:leader peptidase (prepilin peptidase)/N-methyltransferase